MLSFDSPWEDLLSWEKWNLVWPHLTRVTSVKFFTKSIWLLVSSLDFLICQISNARLKRFCLLKNKKCLPIGFVILWRTYVFLGKWYFAEEFSKNIASVLVAAKSLKLSKLWEVKRKKKLVSAKGMWNQFMRYLSNCLGFVGGRWRVLLGKSQVCFLNFYRFLRSVINLGKKESKNLQVIV